MYDQDFINNIKYVIISVIGTHANESEEDIFRRKIIDIKDIGLTFWLQRSRKATPKMVQMISSAAESKGNPCYCLFIEPAVKGGAVPTKKSYKAKDYSKDGKNWINIPDGLSPVTGKMDDNAYALVLNKLEMVNGTIDLWGYADFYHQDIPLKFILGASTVCALKSDKELKKDGMKSRYRRVIAIGELSEPFSVYLRK